MSSIVDFLRDRHLTVAVAESLTGGALAARIVDTPGASDGFLGGVVSYAVAAKADVLGVSREQLELTGPVDREVALAMARGVQKLFGSDVALATTGVAGPGPSDGFPAGTVWVARVGALGDDARLFSFDGARAEVRAAAVDAALALVESP